MLNYSSHSYCQRPQKYTKVVRYFKIILNFFKNCYAKKLPQTSHIKHKIIQIKRVVGK